MYVFPASHYVAGAERMAKAIDGIQHELTERLKELESQNKLVEAQRLRMRTTYDIEMMEQMGFTNGIENYSRHIDGRAAGSAPHCLLDYFPDDFLLIIDESHVTVPQSSWSGSGRPSTCPPPRVNTSCPRRTGTWSRSSARPAWWTRR